MMEQRIDHIERRQEVLEHRLDTIEKQEREYAFTVRDITHKTTIALGMLTAQEADIKGLRADMLSIKATQSDHSELFRQHGEMLRQILMLLQPRDE